MNPPRQGANDPSSPMYQNLYNNAAPLGQEDNELIQLVLMLPNEVLEGKISKSYIKKPKLESCTNQPIFIISILATNLKFNLKNRLIDTLIFYCNVQTT